MQASASMTKMPSPSVMASTGHSLAQVPQAMHSSVILYAMLITSLQISIHYNIRDIKCKNQFGAKV